MAGSERDAAHVAQLAGNPLDMAGFLAARTELPALAASIPLAGSLLGVGRPDQNDAPRQPRVRGGLPARAGLRAGLPVRADDPVAAFEPSDDDRRGAIDGAKAQADPQLLWWIPAGMALLAVLGAWAILMI